jgi:assimilatory nitrate reductase catalytic subunit
MAIVCHCEVVRERSIVAAIHNGARSLADVQEACGAAMRCGGCGPAVAELLARHATPVTVASSTQRPRYTFAVG